MSAPNGEDGAPSAEVVDLAESAVAKLARAKWESSGLTDEDAKRMALRALTGSDVVKLASNFLPTPAMAIPYWDEDGKKHDFFRVRYLEAHKGFPGQAEKQQRYAQPKGSVNGVYFPPLLEGTTWERVLADTGETLYITEGELKACCAVKRGFKTIALGGVDMWHSKRRQLSFFPQLEDINWKNRKVYIIFDSDAATNADVSRAQRQLAKALRDRGADPRIVSLPPAKDGRKQGLDDFLLAPDGGVDSLKELISKTPSLEETDALWAMNEQFVFVDNPVGILVRKDGRLIRERDFDLLTRNRKHMDYSNPQKPKLVSTGEVWLEWRCRFTVDSIVYEPGKPRIVYEMKRKGEEVKTSVRGHYNGWTGWAVAPKKSDLDPYWAFFNVVWKGLAEEHKRWVLQWMAYPIQYPGTKLNSAIVLWSFEQGTGKTLFGYILKDIYGENAKEVNNQQMAGRFTGWRRNKTFIIGDEVASQDDGKANRIDSNKLKGFITSEDVTIDDKFQPAYDIRDTMNFYLTSNNPDAVHVEATDRRFFVHEIKDPPESDEFFAKVDTWRKNGGAAALMYHLLHEVDLTGFNPAARPPMTEAKAEMMEVSRSGFGRWLEEMLKTDGFAEALNSKCDLVTAEQLYRAFRPADIELKTFSDKGTGIELRRQRFEKANGGKAVRTKTWGPQKLVILRNHETWRTATPQDLSKHFDEHNQPRQRNF